MVDYSYGIITISDSCHRDEAIDKSGPRIKVLLQNYFNAFKISQSTVPDEIDEIEKMLLYFSDVLKLNCIITTGGTGCSKRDVTPEATKKVIERDFPQLSILMLFEGLKHTKFAALSRGICGIRGDTLILNFPGSVKAVTECFEAIRELLPHSIQLICDDKNKTQEMHKKIQNDVLPPKYFDVINVQSPERILTAKADDEVKKSEAVPTAKSGQKSTSNISTTVHSLKEQTSSSSSSKFDNFSAFLKQSSSSLDDAMLKGDDEAATGLKSAEKSTSNISTTVYSLKEQTSSSSSSKFNDFFALLKQSSSKLDDAMLKDDDEAENSLIDTIKDSQSSNTSNNFMEKIHESPSRHVCPHKTAKPGDDSDRNSPYPMIGVSNALEIIFDKVNQSSQSIAFKSPMNCPPFRASLKDGYAMKSSSKSKVRNVIGFISAGDVIVKTDFGINECFKINTGAPIPDFADCIVQVEDTKLIAKNADGSEKEIEIQKIPRKNLDIRDVGADLKKNEILFKSCGMLDVAEKTLLASVGLAHAPKMPRIAVISTGDELLDPAHGELPEGKIYDSNTTMLKLLCHKYGFDVSFWKIAKDDYDSLKSIVQAAMKECSVIISSGGVSMGDKDFVKPLLKDLGFEIHFGRVNVKPGKPMTFATNENGISFFGLPGNPVSAFVTFHIFVLPALRFISGFSKVKSVLPTISVILQDTKYELDDRPEYVRATLTHNKKTGLFYALITSNQRSSRITSLIHADVLVQLPPASEVQGRIIGKGWKLSACVIDQFFVTNISE